MNLKQNKIDDKAVKLGYLFGFLAVFIYAVINVLSQLSDVLRITKMDTVIYSLIFVTVKELSASIVYFSFSKSPIQRFKNIVSFFKNQRKDFTLIAIAGIVGGSVGFTLTTAGGIMVGSAMASPFYAIEVIVVLVAMKAFFKRSINAYQMIGVALISLSIILLPILNIILFDGGSIKDKAWLGIILIVLGVFCWAVEAVIFDIVTERSKMKLDTMVGIKQISSLIISVIILFPMFSLIEYQNIQGGYRDLGTIFSSEWRVLLIMISAGALLYVGRVMFFYSVKNVGATTSNGIYNSITIIQIVVSYLAMAIDTNDVVGYAENIHHEYFWVLAITIIIGIGFTLLGQIKTKERL